MGLMRRGGFLVRLRHGIFCYRGVGETRVVALERARRGDDSGACREAIGEVSEMLVLPLMQPPMPPTPPMMQPTMPQCPRWR